MLPLISSRNQNKIRNRSRSRSREQELKIKYSQDQQDEYRKSNTVIKFDRRSNKSEITERQSLYDSDLEAPEQQIKKNLINSKEQSQDDEIPNNQQDQLKFRQNNNQLSPCEIDLEANKKFQAKIEEKYALENYVYLQQRKETAMDIETQKKLLEYEDIKLYYDKQINQKKMEKNNKQEKVQKIYEKINKLESQYQEVNQENQSNQNIVFSKDINYKNQKIAFLIKERLLNLQSQIQAEEQEIIKLIAEIEKLKSKKKDELDEKVNENSL